MYNMMGFYESDTLRATLLGDAMEQKMVSETGLYPEKPLIDQLTWDKIADYYLNHAPDQLELPLIPAIPETLRAFEVVQPDFRLRPPSTTLATFTGDQNVTIGDALTQRFHLFDQALNVVQSAQVKEGAVSLYEDTSSYMLTVMGSFSPRDNTGGMLLSLPKSPTGRVAVPLKDLRRPVHSSFADFNGDGLQDVVVSEFGKWAGRLSIHYLQEDGRYRSEVLHNQTGAIRTEVRDFNSDGLMDIMALFGQGNEGIYIFYNNGEESFSLDPILPFHPSMGSSYFNLCDFNNDGLEDIIYCAGDNADFPAGRKPYHGIYIFENQGDLSYKQTFFYHQNGSYAAIPRDYDQDGDVDIAAISFFPDYDHSPEESFLFLEQTTPGSFTASTFRNPTMGRWIVMDDADYDQDGDMDLLLGSLTFEAPGHDSLMQSWVQGGLPYILLENQLF